MSGRRDGEDGNNVTERLPDWPMEHSPQHKPRSRIESSRPIGFGYRTVNAYATECPEDIAPTHQSTSLCRTRSPAKRKS